MALYHSIQLLLDGEFKKQPLPKFNLQLDSTDDFAIYTNAQAISVHQVKAKISPYRSAFTKALDKSSKVCTDCSNATKRYFHIAQKIDDDSDYLNDAGACVEFYAYNGKKFCQISEIESLTHGLIKSYLIKNSLPCTQILIEKKYCHLSEMISSHVVKIHAKIHAGQSQNFAAYTHVIESEKIRTLLETDFNDCADEEYILLKLRSTFSDAFECYVADDEADFNQEEIKRAELAFNFIYGLDDARLKNVLASLRPHAPSDQLRIEDLQEYADIVMSIAENIVLRDIPHYCKNQKKYLPTAMRLEKNRISFYKRELARQIQENPYLVSLLFEFNVFIATGSLSNLEMEEELERITSLPEVEKMNEYNIVKKVSMHIISKDIAERELND